MTEPAVIKPRYRKAEADELNFAAGLKKCLRGGVVATTVQITQVDGSDLSISAATINTVEETIRGVVHDPGEAVLFHCVGGTREPGEESTIRKINVRITTNGTPVETKNIRGYIEVTENP